MQEPLKIESQANLFWQEHFPENINPHDFFKILSHSFNIKKAVASIDEGKFNIYIDSQDKIGRFDIFINPHEKNMHIEDVYITPENRGKGIYTQLFCNAAQGCKKIAFENISIVPAYTALAAYLPLGYISSTPELLRMNMFKNYERFKNAGLIEYGAHNERTVDEAMQISTMAERPDFWKIPVQMDAKVTVKYEYFTHPLQGEKGKMDARDNIAPEGQKITLFRAICYSADSSGNFKLKEQYTQKCMAEVFKAAKIKIPDIGMVL